MMFKDKNLVIIKKFYSFIIDYQLKFNNKINKIKYIKKDNIYNLKIYEYKDNKNLVHNIFTKSQNGNKYKVIIYIFLEMLKIKSFYLFVLQNYSGIKKNTIGKSMFDFKKDLNKALWIKK